MLKQSFIPLEISNFQKKRLKSIGEAPGPPETASPTPARCELTYCIL